MSERLLVTVRGADRPGLTKAFLDVLSAHDDTALIDVTQLEVHGTLIQSFLLDKSSDDLVKELLVVSNRLELHLEYRMIPNTNAVGDPQYCDVHVVLADPKNTCMTASLLGVVAEEVNTGGFNIEAISESKRAASPFGGMVSFQLKRDIGVDLRLLSTQLTRAIGPSGGWVSVIPNSKSSRRLIVFGLSQVLVKGDVLDEMVNACSGDVRELRMEFSTKKITYEEFTSARIQLLKGFNKQDIEKKVIDRLAFVPGSAEVCRFLHKLGFSIAVVTSTATFEIAKYVKQTLGLDYALATDMKVDDCGMFTGEYGAINDRMRKADLIRLLAVKEGVQNVVLIGDYHTELIDGVGTFIYYCDAILQHHSDLRLVLFLLGYSSEHIHEGGTDQNRVQSTESIDSIDNIPSDKSKHGLLLKIMGKDRPGLMNEILASVNRSSKTVLISEILQRNVQGILCVGLCLEVDKEAVEEVMKEMLFTCHRLSLAVETEDSPAAPQVEQRKRRLIITCTKFPCLTASELSSVVGILSDLSVNILSFRKLAVTDGPLAALEMLVACPEDVEEVRRRLLVGSVDIAVQSDSVARLARKVAVFDMDSTLIQQEVIDELGKLAGVSEKIISITERAMKGEIDFFESLEARVALLKGQNAFDLFERVRPIIQLTPGALELCGRLKQMGFKMAVISGGFLPIAKYVKSLLNLDYAFANELEIDSEGLLTGRTFGPVVTPQRKRELMRMIAEVEGCSLEHVIAVGDGANDILMLQAAGLGVAFCAKPKVQQQTHFRVNVPDLNAVGYLLGIQ